MADIQRKADIEVRLVDPITQQSASVDSSGRLQVAIAATAPPSTTPVVRTLQQSTDTIPVDDNYTITNGKTLQLQSLLAGAELKTTAGGSKVELYYDPNGNKTGMTLISALYVNGNSFQTDLTEYYVGNGTRRIVLRIVGIYGTGREIFGRWKGFEV